VGLLSHYVANGVLPDRLWQCQNCGTWIRGLDFDDPVALTHFDVASYTSRENEAQSLRQRGGFFDHLVRLALRFVDVGISDLRILDVGASYGHLMDRFRELGAKRVDGVEIVEPLRRRLRERGYDGFGGVGEIPNGRQYEIIMLIDSLYYAERPAELLKDLHRRLTSSGVLIVRVTNRTHLLELCRLLGCRISTDLTGDAKHNFSPRGLRGLLQRTGFGLLHSTVAEPGRKYHSATRAWLYRLTLAASFVTFVPLTPGITLVARPAAPTQPGDAV
jgi:2-polyprenyl-3-methyl-5-hydroxy-6-metoxy-1,4-benzoquinol methylase